MGQMFDSAVLNTKPPVPGVIRDIPLEQYAKQTRRLSPAESKRVNDVFGGAIDPNNARAGYDFNIQGTNVKAYVDPRRYPRTGFFDPSGDINQHDFDHEMTHVWQNQTGRGGFSNLYDYGGDEGLKKGGGNLDKFTSEQQASIIADAAKNPDNPAFKPYINFLRSHPAHPLPDGTEAFVDSLRQRKNINNDKDDWINDIGARSASVNGISILRRR